MTTFLACLCWVFASCGFAPFTGAEPLSQMGQAAAPWQSPTGSDGVMLATAIQNESPPLAGVPAFASGSTLGIRRRRRLRVVIYCRFSSDQQNEQSLADQEAACRRLLIGLGLGDAEIEVISDAACSGEMADRRGINRLWELVETKGCDVIVAEEVSRFYRHATRAMQFLESADDEGIRVITINDPIDTTNDDWRLNGHFASLKAELDNRQTRQRINRARTSRWEKNFVVHHTIKPGYRRVPASAPTYTAGLRRPDYRRQPGYDGARDVGPFIEELDKQWTSTIEQAYTMCANDEATWVIARNLIESGLPRSSQAPDDQWTEMDDRKLIRDPLYRGEEVFGRIHIQKRVSKGDSIRVRSKAEDVLRRDMPHLRHVSDWLWHAANDSLDRRRSRTEYKRGPNHPPSGQERDRRSALSTLFFCGVCGAPMYRDGRRYRCGNAKERPGMTREGIKCCWNRCLPSPEMVLSNFACGFTDALLVQEGAFAVLVSEVHSILTSGGADTSRQVNRLERKLAALDRVCRRLAKALETDGDLKAAANLLSKREAERRQMRNELERIRAPRVVTGDLPTMHEFRDILDKTKGQLLDGTGGEANPLLRRLITRIEPHPYKLFDTGELFLRAHFELNLVGFLPDDVRNQLSADGAVNNLPVSRIPVVADLFKVPSRVQLAQPMADLLAGGSTIAQAAKRLCIPLWKARGAAKTATAMAEQGLSDTYSRVRSMPARPPRWKPKSRPDVFDQKEAV